MNNNGFNSGMPPYGGGAGQPHPEYHAAQDAWHGNTKKSRNKALIIIASIISGLLLLGGIIAFTASMSSMIGSTEGISGAASVSGSHVGVLYVEGTISESDDTYNHQFALDAVQGMMDNSDNEALMLYVDTPGGGVYESDELYLKIKEYQETTERPVYAYFASQATSGGYYISASADRITANRNCRTGSIGVTMGTLYDVSGLLEKYGIKAETITSGENKAMGSMTSPLTDEQKQIFQSMIDESYEQFVSIVADGRGLDTDYVKSIADGRIYTAKQAESIKLIDGVVDTYDDAVSDMTEQFGLEHCDIYEFRYQPQAGLLDGLVQSFDRFAEAFSSGSDISALEKIMENNSEVRLQYMCREIR